MPYKPQRLCNHAGCNQLTVNRYCVQHEEQYKQQRRDYDKQRPSYHNWYSSERWRTLRKHILRNNPLCVMCMKQDRLVPATVIDHIQPHKGDALLFWDVGNLQALCKQCHDSKTAREDGGFNNVVK